MIIESSALNNFVYRLTMRKFKLSLFIYVLVLSGLSGNLYAQKRIALLIGNSAYSSSPLANPVNDAIDMGALLKQKHFQVTVLTNAGKRQMEEAIRDFTRQLHSKNSVGLFYFAGHGIEMEGSNYLIPVDAEIQTGIDAKYESVDAGRILDGMESAGNNLNMVILDACRNNPFERRFRSGSKGLAKMDAPKGSLMLYATSPGDVAADGKGRNGLFTQHLLTAMNIPNLKVEEVFKQTAIKVNSASSGQQLPWQTGVILGDFYFNNPVEINIVVEKANTTPRPALDMLELEYWNTIKSTDDPDYYQAYLDKYGANGQFYSLAKLILAKFKQHQTTPGATIPVTINSDKAYLKISTSPADANIKFLNTSRYYNPDMEIDPGRYFIQVSKSGFRDGHFYTKWLELSAGKNYHSITLKLEQENSYSSLLAHMLAPKLLSQHQTHSIKNIFLNHHLLLV